MNKKEELKKLTVKFKLDLHSEIAEVVSEHINKVEMCGTMDGSELYGTPIHSYFLKLLKKERGIIDNLQTELSRLS